MVGRVEMLLIVAGNFAAGYFTLIRQHVDPFHGSAFAPHELARNLAAFAFDFCLLYSMTIVWGAVKRLGAEMAVVPGLPSYGPDLVAAECQFRIDRIPKGVADALWIAIGLLSMVLAQVLLERKEVWREPPRSADVAGAIACVAGKGRRCRLRRDRCWRVPEIASRWANCSR